MSFRCGICNEPQLAGVRAEKIVLESRKKVYPKRLENNDPGGIGKEIVWETYACPYCFKSHKSNN